MKWILILWLSCCAIWAQAAVEFTTPPNLATQSNSPLQKKKKQVRKKRRKQFKKAHYYKTKEKLPVKIVFLPIGARLLMLAIMCVFLILTTGIAIVLFIALAILLGFAGIICISIALKTIYDLTNADA